MTSIKLDHICVGVSNPRETLKVIRRKLGATPLSGEKLPNYRYVLNHVGNENKGMQLELISAEGETDSFMKRFLRNQGEGVHHITFTVPNVEETVENLEKHNFQVVQKRYDYPPWREAFIFPTEPGIGVVIQIADTDRSYPPLKEMLSKPVDDPESIPHNQGGTDRFWWLDIREEIKPERDTCLKIIDFSSDDFSRALLLFEDVLGGTRAKEENGEVTLEWGDAKIRIRAGLKSGVQSLICENLPEDGFSIGSAIFKTQEEDNAK